MNSSQWYSFLLEKNVTMTNVTTEADNTWTLKPCRAEKAESDCDWASIWRKCRLPCLTSEASTLAFKLCHGLLPNESRLAEILPGNTPVCRHGCPGDPVATLEHCILECQKTRDTGRWLLDLVHQYNPAISTSDILRIDIGDNDALAWIVINTILYMWNCRTKGKLASKVVCVTKLSADIDVLLQTKHGDIAREIRKIMNVQDDKL